MLRIYTIEECGEYGVIYCLTSTNGRCYIGQSWSIKTRFGKYKNLSNNIKRQPKLYNALRKYNPSSFKYEIIDLCQSQIEMDNKEAFYIELYDSMNNGFNSISGGKSSGKLSKEARKNISKGKIKYFKSHENNRKGKTHTQEAKNKISETKKRNFTSGKTTNIWKGKKLTKELIKKRIDAKVKLGKLSYYKIVTSNNKLIIIRCLKKFCKINKIGYGTMISSMDPSRNISSPNGFICNKITPEELNILREYILHEYDYPF